jgi:crossover junction endodeoxyribonuclease RuvC
MNLLSIDPGYERMGVAVLQKGTNNKHRLIYSDCWKTSAKLPFNERLLILGEKLELTIKEHVPSVFAVEKLFFETNQKTAMNVAEVRGMLLYIAGKYKLTIFEYTPLQIKVAVAGHGKASKNEVMKMTSLLVDLPKKAKSPPRRDPARAGQDDEYDAIAVGLTCLAIERFPQQ